MHLWLGLNLRYEFDARALELAKNCGLHFGDLGIKGLFLGFVPCAFTHMCLLGAPKRVCGSRCQQSMIVIHLNFLLKKTSSGWFTVHSGDSESPGWGLREAVLSLLPALFCLLPVPAQGAAFISLSNCAFNLRVYAFSPVLTPESDSHTSQFFHL